MSRITATHDVLGTLGYIAPERLEGEPGGPPADVYSLAAVAFEVLSGQRPQRGATPAETLRRSVAEPPPDLREAWPQAPGAAAAVLGRGLDADPDQRPLSAGRLIEELEVALQPGGAVTAADRATRPVRITVSSGRRLRAALVGALLAVAAGVVVLLLAGGGDSPTTSGPSASAGPSRSGDGSDPANEPGSASNTTTTTTTTTAPAPPVAAAGLSGVTLNDQGYALIQDGRYDEAVPVLQRAVDSFPDETDDINYAYALFNLGNALRLAGRPDEAIPILEQRLEFPNQKGKVKRELEAARAAAAGGTGTKERGHEE